MRKNRLHLTFGAEGMLGMPQGHKESYRTKSLDSAKSIISKRNVYYINKAVYRDGQGTETTLIDKGPLKKDDGTVFDATK